MPKTKILYVLTSLCTGGIEKSVIDISNTLDQELFDITILVLSNKINDMQQYIYPHIKLYFLPIKYRNKSIYNILSYLFAIPIIIHTLKKIQPQIIHTHNYLYTIVPFFLVISFFLKKARHFHTVHTSGMHYEIKTRKHKMKLFIENIFYMYLKTTIIFVSPQLYTCSSNIFKSIKSIAHIPNGVDIEYFHKDENTFGQDKKHNHKLVYVARIVEGKGHDTLLEAFSIVCKTHAGIKLLLLGDGKLIIEMKEYVNVLGISENVVFMGNCTDVPNVLRQCTIGVFPSESEGFSIALIEMMATGLPVICSDIPAFTSFLTDRDDVLFFKLNDINDLALKIIYLVNSENMRLKLTYASLTTAQRYSMDKIIKKYEKVYKDNISEY